MTPALLLALFALYAAALDLGAGVGLLGAIALPPGWLLLGAAALLLLMRAVRAVRGRRIAAALLSAGGALALASVPASLLLREVRGLVAVEGREVPAGALPGAATLRFGAVTVAPRGPGFLSKAVTLEIEEAGGAPAIVGLFPPSAVAGWRLSIARYGYAPRVAVAAARARAVDAFVPIGQLSPGPEEASLVAWTPEPNVMMGAGTYPPRLEDLLSPEGTGLHVFLRLDEATLGGARRDLRDPEAWRWLADGRPVDPVFTVLVFQGRERVLDARVPAGGAARFPGGSVEIGSEVRLWVELVAVRDPWIAAGALGLALLVAGGVARAARALAAARGERPGAGSAGPSFRDHG